jgi:hypothetical protein
LSVIEEMKIAVDLLHIEIDIKNCNYARQVNNIKTIFRKLKSSSGTTHAYTSCYS